VWDLQVAEEMLDSLEVLEMQPLDTQVVLDLWAAEVVPDSQEVLEMASMDTQVVLGLLAAGETKVMLVVTRAARA
jgi:hypothetical protein